MRLGAHVSTSGGLPTAMERAIEMGAETIQIFASSPRAWAFKPTSEPQVADYRLKAETADVFPVFLHGSYLVNVAGKPEIVEKSIKSLTDHMNAAGRIGAAGVVFHSGSHMGAGFDGVFAQATSALRQVLSDTPPDVWLIMENSAGMGAHIGSSFQEIGRIIAELASPRVKVCLDTQHSFAAGYDVTQPGGLDSAMEEFDNEIGLSRLVAVHANDSKIELGGGVDRHENVGGGHIGIAGFETIMAHPAFQEVPFVLEVPGIDGKGPDKANLDKLKEIRQRLGVAT